MKIHRLLAALLAASALLAGCVVTPDPYYREPVYVEPPPPRVEYPGYPPVVGYVWIGGFWTWTGHRHEWAPGRWEAPRPGQIWVAPRWDRDGDHWRHQPGRWEAERRPQLMPNQFPAPRFEPRREEHRSNSPEINQRRGERELPRDAAPQRDFEPRSTPREIRPEARQVLPQAPMPPQTQPPIQAVPPHEMPRGDSGRSGGRGGERKDDRERGHGRAGPGEGR